MSKFIATLTLALSFAFLAPPTASAQPAKAKAQSSDTAASKKKAYAPVAHGVVARNELVALYDTDGDGRLKKGERKAMRE